MEVVLKPIVMSVLLLLTPIQILAGASPILVPLLFLMSRRDSVDRGWQRAGMVGAGLTVVLTALYVLSVTSN